jgi:REP element-mobilizing transposase RayT
MRYDPEIHHRRSIRLPTYDYSRSGAYFVTLCTFQRELVLESQAVAAVVIETWRTLPIRFPSISLDEFVIMPNHFHGIIVLQRDVVQGAASGAPTLGGVIRAFKSLSAIGANRTLGRSDRPFWQRNYYERVIRNEDELYRIREYILENPAKWAQDKNNPINWRAIA